MTRYSSRNYSDKEVIEILENCVRLALKSPLHIQQAS
jgi:phage-related holin